MAAAIGKDLRLEIEKIMQSHMINMLSVLEERITKAMDEGQITIPQPIAVVNPADNCYKEKELLKGANFTLPNPEQSDMYERLMDPEQDGSPQGALEALEALSGRGSTSAREMEFTRSSTMVDPREEQLKIERHVLNLCTLLLLLVNAIGDAFEVDYEARHDSNQFPSWYKFVQFLLSLGFIAELIKRISLRGSAWFFCKSAGLHWHYFQLYCCGTQMIEMSIILRDWWFQVHFSPGALTRQWFRISGIVQIFRLFYILDHLDFTTELHLLLASMYGSLYSLGWAALFILIPMFLFGMGLTAVVSEFRVSSGLDADALSNLMHFYGTLDRSFLTLFFAISGGLSWSDAVMPLRHHGFFVSLLLFIGYVAVMIFAVLNVLTGVFVNSAESAASSEKERRILALLRQIFNEVDYDGSGNLTQEEFKALLTHKDIGICLQTLNIPPAQATHLFNLIDSDGSGAVAIDEFLNGCDKLQGSLKAIDFATFVGEFHHLKDDVDELSLKMEIAPSPKKRSKSKGI